MALHASFLYPVKGIAYFASHRFLHPFLRSRLVPATLLSAGVLATLFVWTYLPQAAFMAIFHGRAGALVNAAVLVLGEGAAVTALLFEAFFVDGALLGVFDAVLVAEGCEKLVATSRVVLPETGPADGDASTGRAGQDSEAFRSPDKRLGRLHDRGAVYSPFSLRQIAEFILLLPLNFVPWVGVPLFLWLTGYRAGPLQHHRYFELKSMRKGEKRDFVKQRRHAYTAFGSMALVLQLVPVLSMVFLLTTAAGSALWASDVEKAHDRTTATTAPADDDQPPNYEDLVDDPV